MVGLVFSIFNIFTNKISRVNKLSVEKDKFLRKPGFNMAKKNFKLGSSLIGMQF